jgi:hypothetical protein
MESRTAIWKLTLTTDGTTPLVANQVSLSIGGNPIAATALDGTGKSEWTLVLVPATIALYSGDFTITAAVGTNAYTYTKAGGITLVNGKYYQSTVTMAGPYKLAAAATSSDKDKLICTDGHIHAKEADAGCTATRVAVITYVGAKGTADASSTSYKGLALALADASTNAKWCDQTTLVLCLGTGKQKGDETAAKGDMAGIANTDYLINHTYTPTHTHAAAKAARDYKYVSTAAAGAHPTGTSAWFLPSAGQWNKMFYANGSDESRYSDLNTTITNAGGTGLATGPGYWSSTECDDDEKAWQWCDADILDSNPVLGWDKKEKESSSTIHVRACLAF